jgi:geranylgeranyl diphosphate synthase type I
VLDYFSAAKRGIADTIETALAGSGREWAAVSGGLGADAARRLAEFSVRGKMLRGCLVRLGYELAGGRTPSGGDDEALRLAGAAMELFQSGLLVHDDIMDGDRVRRGAPTLHVAYADALGRGRYGDPAHNGESLAICAGDIAYFAAFQALSELPVADAAARRVMGIAARELSLVGVAQMQDVANGAARHGSANPFGGASCDPDEDSVLGLYRYKTGRYTFSMPLALGAAIAGGDDRTLAALEAAGESLGILFQLKDDELGLFADEAELGKPVGADIRENKKTLFRLRLFQKADAATAARLEAIFGDRDAGQAEADFVRAELERLGVRGELADAMRRYADEAAALAGGLVAATTPEAARAFNELVAYSLQRRA